jgi:Escherichia/Staphylococcus phage prohead protease
MEIKSFPVTSVKSVDGDDPAGTFEAVVSVFGNVDGYGDRVEPGAFADSLAKGLPAVVWSHRWDEPPIGAALEATETDEGLLVKSQLFIDANVRAREVHAAMSNLGGDGRPPLREFSFAYDVLEAAWITEKGEDDDAEREIYSLKRLDLIEVGPCLKGVNPETRLVGVKGLERVRPKRPSDVAESSDDDRTHTRKARNLITMTVQPLTRLGTPGDRSD